MADEKPSYYQEKALMKASALVVVLQDCIRTALRDNDEESAQTRAVFLDVAEHLMRAKFKLLDRWPESRGEV